MVAIKALTPESRVVGHFCHAVHLLSLPIIGGILVWANQRQWFFGDEWDFLVRRGVVGGELGLFFPHNEHWSTGPILVYRALFCLFGVRSYMPYVIVLTLFHLATVHLLWRVLMHVQVSPPLALAFASLFGLYGGGSENLLWAFQIGFIGSVGIGLAVVLVVDHPSPSRRRQVAAVILTIVGLTFSGVTLTMTVVAALVVLFRRGARAAAGFLFVPSVVYVVWYLSIGRSGRPPAPVTADSLFQLSSFISAGVFRAFEAPTGLRGAGPVLAFGLAGWLLGRRDLTSGAQTAASLAGGAVVLFLVIGVARASLGVDQATASRYVYLAGCLLIPGAALALTDLARARWGATLAIGAVVALSSVHGLGELRSSARNEGDREQGIRARILAAAALLANGEPIVDVQPEPIYDPDLTAATLDGLRRGGRLPTSPAPTELDLLGARAALQVAVLPRGDGRAVDLGQTILSTGVSDAMIERDQRGCIVVRPTGPAPLLELDLSMPGSLVITLAAPGEISVALRSQSSMSGTPRAFGLGAGPSLISIVASPIAVTLALPPVPGTTICGLRS